jgi:glycosyltransferase involved in cell wall biosynthesis
MSIDRIYILILNYNSFQETLKLYESLSTALKDEYHLLVIDNPSPVTDRQKLKKSLPMESLLLLDTNKGYASRTVFWRKGHDVFIQVARYIKENHTETQIQFVWVGKISPAEQVIVHEDLLKLGLVDSVHFVGQQENPHPYFEDFDLFLMTSREDPFPLVCIEVGMMGKPIVCFDKATGTQEVIEKGGGRVVPYLNVEKMAAAVVDYYEDRELLKTDGLEAQELFSKFTPEIQCPQIFDILKNV